MQEAVLCAPVCAPDSTPEVEELKTKRKRGHRYHWAAYRDRDGYYVCPLCKDVRRAYHNSSNMSKHLDRDHGGWRPPKRLKQQGGSVVEPDRDDITAPPLHEPASFEPFSSLDSSHATFIGQLNCLRNGHSISTEPRVVNGVESKTRDPFFFQPIIDSPEQGFSSLSTSQPHPVNFSQVPIPPPLGSDLPEHLLLNPGKQTEQKLRSEKLAALRNVSAVRNRLSKPIPSRLHATQGTIRRLVTSSRSAANNECLSSSLQHHVPATTCDLPAPPPEEDRRSNVQSLAAGDVIKVLLETIAHLAIKNAELSQAVHPSASLLMSAPPTTPAGLGSGLKQALSMALSSLGINVSGLADNSSPVTQTVQRSLEEASNPYINEGFSMSENAAFADADNVPMTTTLSLGPNYPGPLLREGLPIGQKLKNRDESNDNIEIISNNKSKRKRTDDQNKSKSTKKMRKKSAHSIMERLSSQDHNSHVIANLDDYAFFGHSPI